MKAKHRFYLAVVVLGLLMTGPFVVTSLLVWLDMKDAERTLLTNLLLSRLPVGTLMTVFGFILGVGVLHKLFQQYVQGLLRMAETLRLMLGANRNFRVALDGAPEVQALAKAANDLAQQRDELMDDVDAQVARAKASVEEEKNRLAALMSELAQAVVVCNLDGRILLYNSRARLQFKALSDTPTAAGGGELIGLGRSIYTLFERNLISHALESIQHRLRREGAQPVANFVTTTRAGQLIRVNMAPVMGAVTGSEGEAPERVVTGYVLTLDNITRSFETESNRDEILQTLTEGSRASLANVRAAVETLLDYPDMEGEDRDRFVRVISDEVRIMSQRLDNTSNEFAGALKARWPLEEMLGTDLVAAAQRRIESLMSLPTKLEELDPDAWVKVDSFSLIQGLAYLAWRLKDDLEVREVRFRMQPAGRLVHLDLIWTGTMVSTETLMNWELESMNIGAETSPLTLRDVIDRHGGEIWAQREKVSHRQFFRLLLPSASPQESLAAETYLRGDSRPEYYDFDLFRTQESSHELDDRLLSELTFTVFDTETTGLRPSEGDEIIQIGGARIVNGKLLRQEVFDQLVDPRRPLDPESAHIHGITAEMLENQPTIHKVLPAFHAFCSDTVLVAHNAAFDMRFLQMKEDVTGIKFTQPLLDTLLLSAVIHPNQESHRLEAIAERLGVNIIGRHNAVGDSIVTGEVFLKMLPLLAEKGIRTLREAREASEKSYYARVKY